MDVDVGGDDADVREVAIADSMSLQADQAGLDSGGRDAERHVQVPAVRGCLAEIVAHAQDGQDFQKCLLERG